MLITEVEGVEEEEISLDGSPPVPNKREEDDDEEIEEGEERALEGEMVKELEVKRLEDADMPVSRRKEELMSS